MLLSPIRDWNTNLRPDSLLASNTQPTVYFIELTVLWDEAIDRSYERKKVRYGKLSAEREHRCWRTKVCPGEVRCSEFVAISTTKLKKLGVCSKELCQTINAISDVAEISSLWLKRKDPIWAQEHRA